MCARACVFIKVHKTAQSGPVILVISMPLALIFPRGIKGSMMRCVCVRVYVRSQSSRGEGFLQAELVLVLVCVCVFSSHLFWTSSSLDVPAGVTQEEGHTGFFIHLLYAVRALIFLARRIQPFLSLVDREVEFCVLTI